MSAVQPEHSAVEAPSSPGFMLAQLGRGATELYRTALAGTGLKPPHVATLIQLRSEPVGQQALSDATGIDAVKLVGILNDLETAALVERRRDLVDRRRHIVAITGAGRARLDDVERAAAAADARLLAGLTPVQREQLAALLRLVIQSSQVAEPCPGLAAAQAEGAGDESACGSD